MTYLRCILVMAILCAWAWPAQGQTPVVPTVLQGPCGTTWTPIDADKKPLLDDAGKPVEVVGELTRRYLSGNWATFQDFARQLLNAAATTDLDRSYSKDCKGDVYRVGSAPLVLAWADTDAFGERTLYSALVATPDPEPYATTLPGVTGFRQIFVARQPTHVLASLYVSTEVANPLLDQIPAVAEAVINPLAAVAAQLGGAVRTAVRAAPTGKPSNIWTTVANVNLPDKRAALEFKAVASIEPTPNGIEQRVEGLALRLRTNDARHSSCAIKVVSAYRTLLKTKTVECSAATSPDSTESCIAKVDEPLMKEYETVTKSCGTLSRDELKIVRGADAEFRKLLTGLSATDVTGSGKLTNAPKSHISFGLVTGVMALADVTKERVKVKDDDGTLANDPLGRQLSLVVVNSSFKSYDAAALSVSDQERWRWFGGAVVSPGFGVGGGLSVLIVRGFGFNVGGAFIAVNARKGDDEIGKVPASSTDPFAVGWARTVFVGASYNFK